MMNLDSTRTQKRSIRFSIAAALCLMLVAGTISTSRAQSVAGRISFGFDVDGNKYYGNFSDNQFGLGGDAFIRWNVLDWVSLVASYNAGVLHYSVTPVNILANPTYFGTPTATTYPGTMINRNDQNNIRYGGWELMGQANVFPSQTFVPYFTAGIEALNFEPKTANDAQALPNNANAVYSKNVIGGVVGVGFEMYISDKVTFNGRGLLHLTGTDWLDDYSNPNNFRQDAFLTFGLGFSYYIFAPDIVRTAPMHEVDQTTIIHETTIVRNDTVYIKEAADTVFMNNPKVNTVYNFPGTLFIVNTDEFNTAVSGNLQNLYKIKELVNQCPNLKVEVQGYASAEGTPQRNQELSELRATKIKSWLISQGVSADKVPTTVGYGTIADPPGLTGDRLEAARVFNRRIAVKVLQACN